MKDKICKNCGSTLQFDSVKKQIYCEFCGFSYDLLDDMPVCEEMGISAAQMTVYRRVVKIIKQADCATDWQTALDLLSRVGGILDAAELMEICKENLKICTQREDFTRAHTLCEANDIFLLKNAIRLFEQNPEWENCEEKILQCEKKIEQLEKSQIIAEKHSDRKRRFKKLVSTVVSVAVIAAIVVAVVYYTSYQKRKHDVDLIKVDIVSMQSKHNFDESVYINGCYYIYLDYEIENNTYTKIDSISLKVKFKDDTGRVVYQVSSSFGGYGSAALGLEPNENGRYQSFLKEGATNADEAFLKIYGKELSDLEVSVSVDKVTFSDGHNY